MSPPAPRSGIHYPPPAPARRAALRGNLRRWFRRAARDLPFRRTRDPYRIWLAEVILQQTRMETGLAYYRRFLAALPSVEALAAAEEETVLKLWEGLGYYRRARNLHRAARRIVEERGGSLPATAAGWQALPGVGRYTAGAVASIAGDEPVAVLDGNVKRVLARLFAIGDCIDDSRVTAALWGLAEALVPRRGPGEWNQALMELGALVCLPRGPRCAACPVRNQCAAHRRGEAELLPVRRARAAVPHKQVAAACVERRGRLLLCRRPPGGMLAGLWELPGGELRGEETAAEALVRVLEEDCRVTGVPGAPLAAVEHGYSHFTMTLTLYAAAVRGRARPGRAAAVRWVRPVELGAYALPTADRRLLAAAGIEAAAAP